MSTVRRAVIDVGTNSIKLLVADVAGSTITPFLEDSRQTRLGRGFYRHHRLQDAAIKETATAVAEFAARARQLHASTVRVIATSAARDAANAPELTRALEDASGLKVEIISGDQEADWAFQGVTTDPSLANAPLLLLDVGGGSTEFILGRGETVHFRQSFALGTVRLMELIPHSEPPKLAELADCRTWLRKFLRDEVQPRIQSALAGLPAAQLVGTGGTATILGRIQAHLNEFDRERIEAASLDRDDVRRHVEVLWGLPLAKRREIVGLPSDRADVILTGAAIYEAIMEQFGFGVLRVSTRGLRFAAVMADPKPPATAVAAKNCP